MPGQGASACARACRKFALPSLLLAFATTSAPVAAASDLAPNNPIGVHSMLYPETPLGGKEAMFKEAAAVGASTIRLDIELAAVFPSPGQPPDWTGVDQYVSLARRYHLRVLADLLATPTYMANCPPGTPPDGTHRCPPTDPARWGHDAGLIAAHTRGTIDYFEIVNEPDGSWAFLGTPEQYAAILQASYDAIHAANPHALVALGGLMNTTPAGESWINSVLSTPGAHAGHKFDIANIHVRTPAAQTGVVVCRWRHYFASKGFHGLLWVTEAGYPADPAWQTDPAYRGGPTAQARYLAAAVPNMIQAGANKVFLTERDSLTGRYATEGFLQAPDPLPDDPTYTRRPSFYTIQKLARRRWQAPDTRQNKCHSAG